MRKILILLCTLFLLLATATAGQALCIYNHTDYVVSASNKPWILSWSIQKHTHRCTDGKHGGDWGIQILKKGGDCISPPYTIHIYTEGWLSIYHREGDTWKAVSHNAQGEVKYVKYLKYKTDDCVSGQ